MLEKEYWKAEYGDGEQQIHIGNFQIQRIVRRHSISLFHH